MEGRNRLTDLDMNGTYSVTIMRNPEKEVEGNNVDGIKDEELEEAKVVFVLGDEEDSSDVSEEDGESRHDHSPKSMELQACLKSCQKDGLNSDMFSVQVNGTCSSDSLTHHCTKADLLVSKLNHEALEMEEKEWLENMKNQHFEEISHGANESLCVSPLDDCVAACAVKIEEEDKLLKFTTEPESVDVADPCSISGIVNSEMNIDDRSKIQSCCAVEMYASEGAFKADDSYIGESLSCHVNGTKEMNDNVMMCTKDPLVIGDLPSEETMKVLFKKEGNCDEDVGFSPQKLTLSVDGLDEDNMIVPYSTTLTEVGDTPTKNGVTRDLESLIHAGSLNDSILFGDPMMNDGDEEGHCVEVKGTEGPVLMDAPTKGLVLSASCGLLSGMGQSGTPHKLSVDPGAASLTASPAMSPHRDPSKEGLDPSSSDSCDYAVSYFQEKNHACRKDKEMSEKYSTCGQESTLNDKDTSNKFLVEFEKFLKGTSKRKKHDKKPQRMCKPSKVQKVPAKLQRKKLDCGQERAEALHAKRKRTKSMSELKTFSEKINKADQDEDWTADEVYLQGKTARKVERMSPEKDLEYNLRPKRRKSFHFFSEGCECCHENPTRQRPLNIRNFIHNHQRVIDLRQEVCRLFHALFPDLEYPQRFSKETLSVEHLMDQVMDAVGDVPHRPLALRPFGPLSSDVQVLLCKTPQGCLHHLRRKVCRLLKALLPDLKLKDGFDCSGAEVDSLLTKVINSNAQ